MDTNDDDIPMISPPSDSAVIPLTPQKEAPVNVPDQRRNPTTAVPKPAAPAAPARPAAPQAAKPAGDAASASRPAAPAVKAPIPAPVGDDEDGEKLLREYAERQKTKVVRIEQEFKKVAVERDALRVKVDAIAKELETAKKQIEAASRQDDVIKDLQGKVDAAILSNSILTEDKKKLKEALSQQTEHLNKAQERAAAAEKSLAESQEKLVTETQAREEAQSKVAAALEALQSESAPVARSSTPPKAVSEAVTRPMKVEEKSAPPKDEKAATNTDGAAKPAPGAKPGNPPPGQQRPPGRFSFLKK